ncbi:MAG: hypothetical protein NE327_21120 [Lentisphaeraceae bacterium]|nr:hypothetical protein [Lentisphaeraceae bacterium]
MSPREPRNFIKFSSDSTARAAIFVSGSGTNAEKILDFWQDKSKNCSFEPVCIVTDRPGKCKAKEIAQKYKLPLIDEDINQFYKSKGLSSISLATEEGRKVREEWTESLYTKIKSLNVDFGIFAGFIPLTNITDHFPCLNVHPGDLTVCDENGDRVLVGLHTIPVHKAFEAGYDCMRSSVIVACAYEDGGDGMDEGIVVGISQEVPFDYLGKDEDYWLAEFKKRPSKKPTGGWKDKYQEFLSHNQEKLKISGDWVVFPQVVNDFAAGKYAHFGQDLFYKSGSKWLPVSIIEYTKDKKEIFFRS